MQMDENVFWLRLWQSIGVVGLIFAALLIGYNAHENALFVQYGYCERPLLGSQHTVWQKCDATSR